MFMWTILILIVVGAFFFNDLPKWLDKAKKEGNKLKDIGLKKVDEIKSKNKNEDGK